MEEKTPRAVGSRCGIRRFGLVKKIGEDGVTVEINGKPLRLPREKVAADAAVGDTIAWDGKIWTASNDGEMGTSNMRKA